MVIHSVYPMITNLAINIVSSPIMAFVLVAPITFINDVIIISPNELVVNSNGLFLFGEVFVVFHTSPPISSTLKQFIFIYAWFKVGFITP